MTAQWTINCVGQMQRQATEVEAYAVVKANFIVNFHIYSDISDAKTLKNSIFFNTV